MTVSLTSPDVHVVQATSEAEAREKAARLIERLGGGSVMHVEHRVTALRRAGKRSPNPADWITKSSTWIVYVSESGGAAS